MTGLRERNRKKRHDHIVATAWSLFSTKGYDATSVEEIAEAAEVSVGTLYNFFGTKGALLIAVLEKDLGNIPEQIAPFARQASADPPQALIQLLRFLMAAADQHSKAIRRRAREIALDQINDEEDFKIQSFRIIEEALTPFFDSIGSRLAGPFTPAALCRIFADIVFTEYQHYLLNEPRTAEDFLQRVDATAAPLWSACLEKAEEASS